MAGISSSNQTSDRDNNLVEIVGADGTAIGNTTDRLKVDGSSVTQPVSAASLPLPTGASTAANQATSNTALSSIDTKTPAMVSGRQPVDGSGVTQPVSAASLPLPAGASTSALQTTGNSSLSSIDVKTPALGQAVMASSVPVTLASNQSSLPVSVGYGLVQTYSMSASAFVPPALPTDVFTIQGSATKVIKITAISASFSTSTPIDINFTLVRRSTANTGGTSTVLTSVAHDTTNSAATAVGRSYTANPSALGTSLGSLRAQRYSVGGTGLTDNNLFYEFSRDSNQPIVLRGTSEFICLNLGATTILAPNAAVYIQFTEE